MLRGTELPPGIQMALTNREWTIDGSLPGGKGGFGQLYVVHDNGGDEAVAKLVEKDPGADRELLIGAAINAAGYTNVVPVLDHGEHGDDLVLVMPRAETNLAEHLKEHGPLGVDEVIAILVDVATALDAISNDLVHRDIKPKNILLLEGKWCLADFGISRYAEATTSPDTRKFMMSYPYAAPEQWRSEHATSATDVYAFGVVGYELLAGQLPFPGPDGADFREQHLNEQASSLTVGPSGLRDLIEECLFKPPEARPTPTAIVRRLARAAQPTAAAAGLDKLAQANRAVIQTQATEHAEASSEQQRQQWRQRLHDTATQMFDRVQRQLVDNIQDIAPAATIESGPAPLRSLRQTEGKLFIATLNGAQIGLDQPQPSPSNWTTPFTVIAESVIAVTRPQQARDGWAGRSHSLWFCDAKEENLFEWYELAFWDGPYSHPTMEPFAGSAAGNHIAFEPVMAKRALAWPITVLDRSDLSEFIGRWLGWFGDAARGRLERPNGMPERHAEGSWRRT
ncbi:serine/threonine-protein kinase [Mycobacterium intracellulare]|uniref:serine/threonine-protein kinase n=1 Tax=Mycobacterium intracellulare TaxID=1767 RepID=UPI001FF9509B|nr:serine/threonine-protein kinase [Mycobacterium intracellulare]